MMGTASGANTLVPPEDSERRPLIGLCPKGPMMGTASGMTTFGTPGGQRASAIV
ncbi:hypothetical protein FRB94_006824 [Tulasnella sp. JGI-2019a]|nr:hypothetical protein FRB94_006824 [Tulasnella sp. JGI-2019a]